METDRTVTICLDRTALYGQKKPGPIKVQVSQELQTAGTHAVSTDTPVAHPHKLRICSPSKELLLQNQHFQASPLADHMGQEKACLRKDLWPDETKMGMFGLIDQWYVWRR